MGTAESGDPLYASAAWLDEFSKATSAGDENAMRELFAPDCYWRDVVAFSGGIRTIHGRDEVIADLMPLSAAAGPTGFSISPELTAPSLQPRGVGEVIEAFFDFETELFRCKGVVRLDPADLRAVAFMSSAQELKGYEEPVEGRRPDLFEGAPWSFDSEDPDVLIVGAGQAGLCLAARLRMMGVPTLVVEKNERVGDNWRKRYRSLKLHNIIQVNKFPFMSFPSSWPTYLPKDLYGDWLEVFAKSMDIEVWTETIFAGGEYDDGRWTVRVSGAAKGERVLHPRHVVMASGGFASVPNIPELPGLDQFEGTWVHTTKVGGGEEFANQKVTIMGAGTSAHDLSVELIKNGCEVTMIQRSPIDVISLEAANLYLGLFVERPAEEVDLISAANSADVTRGAFQQLTQVAAEMDRELRSDLERVGFRTSLGVEDAGYFWDFLQKGGSYYIDVGACKNIIDGTVRVIQADDVERFGPKGTYLLSSELVEADSIILATGFAPQEREVEALFGDEVARRVGRIWGYGDDGELRNTWVPTRQEGLWFMGGGIPHARDYSRYVAIQLKLGLLGLTVGTRDASLASHGGA